MQEERALDRFAMDCIGSAQCNIQFVITKEFV